MVVQARYCPSLLVSSHMRGENRTRHPTLNALESGLAHHLFNCAAPGFRIFSPERDELHPPQSSVFRLLLSEEGFFSNYGLCFLMSLWIERRASSGPTPCSSKSKTQQVMFRWCRIREWLCIEVSVPGLLRKIPTLGKKTFPQMLLWKT